MKDFAKQLGEFLVSKEFQIYLWGVVQGMLIGVITLL